VLENLLDEVCDIKSRFDSYETIFSFNGTITYELLTNLGALLRQNLDAIEKNQTRKSKVFIVFIEELQNVLFYSKEKYPKTGDNELYFNLGIVLVGYINDIDKYFIVCGNAIDKEDVKKIESKIESIKSLDTEELKSMYKQKRREKNRDKGSKGAGLGFIEIARKTTEMDYKIFNLKDDLSFFVFEAII